MPTNVRPAIARYALLLAAGGVALLAGRAVPLVSPLLIALLFGAIVVNLPGVRTRVPAGLGGGTKLLLRLGVVVLGTRLAAADLTRLGWAGIGVIVAVVAITYFGVCAIGDRLGLDRGLVTMIAAGTAVCGAAAIAAVETGIRRRTEDVALAIALITLLGTASLLAVPALARALGLGDVQTAVWIGAAVHEVAQVVAGAAIAGGGATAVAMAVKLGRVVLLAPVYTLARARFRAGAAAGPEAWPEADVTAADVTAPDADSPGGARSLSAGAIVPWFVIGFLATATARTLGFIPSVALDPLNWLATILLAGAMFGLGLGLDLKRLLPVNLRAVGLAVIGAVIAMAVALAGTLTTIHG
jgi:uncharacterized integral membrane protein (TIGR00698 family)